MRANCGRTTCVYANWHVNESKLSSADLNGVMVSITLVSLALDSCGAASTTGMGSEPRLAQEQVF